MGVTWNDVSPALVEAMVGLRPGGMVYRRVFPGRMDQVPAARRFVRFLLEDSPGRDDAEQIIAELVANAIKHTSSGRSQGTFIVELTRKTALVRITVYDCGWGTTPRFGSRSDAGPLAEHSWGLTVVTALASRGGFRGTRAKGHAVWAEIFPV